MTNERTAASHVEVHTDGACCGNPGPGGWAFTAEFMAGAEVVRRYEASGSEPGTTNSRMEMRAGVEALRFCLKAAPGASVTITSDSQFLVRGASEWLPGWKAKGWRKSDGKPVANQDLWLEIEDLSSRAGVSWRWTRGHAGHSENERVDMLASAAAERFMRELQAVAPA